MLIIIRNNDNKDETHRRPMVSTFYFVLLVRIINLIKELQLLMVIIIRKILLIDCLMSYEKDSA